MFDKPAGFDESMSGNLSNLYLLVTLSVSSCDESLFADRNGIGIEILCENHFR